MYHHTYIIINNNNNSIFLQFFFVLYIIIIIDDIKCNNCKVQSTKKDNRNKYETVYYIYILHSV